jgi:hypothetical protein
VSQCRDDSELAELMAGINFLFTANIFIAATMMPWIRSGPSPTYT